MKKCKICGCGYKKGLVCNHEMFLASKIPHADNPELGDGYWRKLALRLQNIGVDLVEKLDQNGVKVMRIR